MRVYGRTRVEVHEKLTETKSKANAGILIAERQTKLGDYLDYWLEEFVKVHRRPKTYEQYEVAVRLYLKPALAKYPLSSLTVPLVQGFINEQLRKGSSVRKVQIVRTTLSAALTRAQREELVTRNVARLVELPQWERQPIHPWSVTEAKRFLAASKSSVLHPAFLMLVLYGMRRGEVLGIRWQDIDFGGNTVHVRQQLQRVGQELLQGPVKTSAGKRDLPLLPVIKEALTTYRASRPDLPHDELVFTTRVGTPIEPRNFVRSF